MAAKPNLPAVMVLMIGRGQLKVGPLNAEQVMEADAAVL